MTSVTSVTTQCFQGFSRFASDDKAGFVTDVTANQGLVKIEPRVDTNERITGIQQEETGDVTNKILLRIIAPLNRLTLTPL